MKINFFNCDIFSIAAPILLYILNSAFLMKLKNLSIISESESEIKLDFDFKHMHVYFTRPAGKLEPARTLEFRIYNIIPF